MLTSSPPLDRGISLHFLSIALLSPLALLIDTESCSELLFNSISLRYQILLLKPQVDLFGGHAVRDLVRVPIYTGDYLEPLKRDAFVHLREVDTRN